MKKVPKTPDFVKTRRSMEPSSFQNFSFDSVHAVSGFAGSIGVRYRSHGIRHFSFTQYRFFPRYPCPPIRPMAVSVAYHKTQIPSNITL